MIILTDSLQDLAGDAIRKALMRFTKSPLSGAVTGATGTAILQSSSATTVAAVGFVGAGLLTFPEALGIIFGANIGTTITGWMVAVLGFKFQLGTFVLPLIFVGAILRLFAKGRLAAIGLAIAGFGLIFVAITLMQQGMSGMEGVITPEKLPPDSFIGRLELVALGILATVITQSSSAGIAAAITLLYAGSINFPQAAALVIGMNVGTTVTAAMATIGGSVAVKRTGYSHVIYNLFTAVGALILITPFAFAWESLQPGGLRANGEIALVAFHTLFNTLGVIAVLPLTSKFEYLMIRLVPAKGPGYTNGLETGLLEQPTLALSAVQNSINNESLALLFHLNAILGAFSEEKRVGLSELQSALDETRAYIDKINLQSGVGADWERLIALIHTLDHLQRLHERCEEEEDRAVTARETPELIDQRDLLIECVNAVLTAIEQANWNEAVKVSGETSEVIHDKVRPYRLKITEKIASGEMSVIEGTECLEAIRWLRRVSKHIARIMQHYTDSLVASGK